MNPETRQVPAVHEGRTTGAPVVKRGCSCWVIVLLSLIITVGLLIAGYHAMQHYYTSQIRRLYLNDQEWVEFQKWQSETHNIAYRPPKLSPEARALVHAESKRIMSAFESDLKKLVQSGTITAMQSDKLRGNEWLNDHELMSFTTVTERLSTHVIEMARHVNRPDYIFDTSELFVSESDGLFFVQPYLTLHLFTLIEKKDWAKFPLVLDTLFKSLRPGEYNQSYGATHYGRGLRAIVSAESVSQNNVEMLEKLLSILTNNNPSLYLSNDPSNIKLYYMRLIDRFEREGYPYKKKRLITNREIQQAGFEVHRFFDWIRPRLSPNDKLAKHINSIKSTNYATLGPPWLETFRKKMPTDWRYRFDRVWAHVELDANMILQWDFWQDYRERARLIPAQYDLTRLFLARRIAALRGDPLPVTQSDFVPRYLPDWPTDPFSPTGAGFSFDATRNEFYSVGEDGASSTADDVYLERPSPESLTSATQSLDKEPAP